MVMASGTCIRDMMKPSLEAYGSLIVEHIFKPWSSLGATVELGP